PIPVATDVSRAGRRLVARELARKPDLVVVDFPHTQALMPPHVGIPSVLFTHNVEAEIFRRHLAVANSPLWRAIWKNQLIKMECFEASTLRTFDAVIAVSEYDQRQFSEAYGVQSETIPTGVDLDAFQYRMPGAEACNGPNIVFTAAMDSFANI